VVNGDRSETIGWRPAYQKPHDYSQPVSAVPIRENRLHATPTPPLIQLLSELGCRSYSATRTSGGCATVEGAACYIPPASCPIKHARFAVGTLLLTWAPRNGPPHPPDALSRLGKIMLLCHPSAGNQTNSTRGTPLEQAVRSFRPLPPLPNQSQQHLRFMVVCFPHSHYPSLPVCHPHNFRPAGLLVRRGVLRSLVVYSTA
jgi:hypothetical protein